MTVLRIIILVVLLYVLSIDGSTSCNRKRMCSGFPWYGDNRCYSPGQLMGYGCTTYICKRKGNNNFLEPYVTECKYRGECYHDGQSVKTGRRVSGRCEYMKCYVHSNVSEMIRVIRQC